MLTTIKHGDSGSLVKAAQLLTGYADRNNASGQFDAGFVAHIVAWQGNHKITADGETFSREGEKFIVEDRHMVAVPPDTPAYMEQNLIHHAEIGRKLV